MPVQRSIKVQKKISQQDVLPQPLLKDSEIRAGYKYADLSQVQVVSTLFGRAKVQKINQIKKKESRWLWGVGVMLVITAWLLLEWSARQQSASSASVVEPVMEIELVPTPDLPAQAEPALTSPTALPAASKQASPVTNIPATHIPAKAAATKPDRPKVVKPAASRPSQNIPAPQDVPLARGSELQNKPANILPALPDASAPTSVAPPVVVSPIVGEPQSVPPSGQP